MRRFLHALTAFLVALAEFGQPQGGYVEPGTITPAAMKNGASVHTCPGCAAALLELQTTKGPGALCTTCSAWWAPLVHQCVLRLKREPDLLS